MVIKKLIFFIFGIIIFFSYSVFGNPNIDQWLDTEKSYKDLINEGYEVKSYSISDIRTNNGLILLLFVTVLQKDKEVFECQEYQTLDEMLETLNLSFVCRRLVQPYKIGVDT